MNSSTPHTDAFCNPPQFANFPWGLSTVLSFLLHCSLRLRKWVPPPFLWSWCHGWVGWGAKKKSTSFLKRDPAWCWQWRSSPFTGTSWCRGARRRGGGDFSPLLQAPGRDHPSLFCFVVGQHASAGLGPCPNDPLRCGLNSSTPHTDAFCNPPQFANFPWGLSTVLSFLLHCSLRLRKWVPPPFLWSWCHGWVGWGAKKKSTSFLKRDPAWCWQWRSSPFTGTSWCRGARRRGGGDFSPLLQAPGRDHPSLFCFVVGQHAVAG